MVTTAHFAAAATTPLVASWLLTYAIHSTLLLGLAWVVTDRLREQEAWLDWMWKAALVGAVMTATVQSAVVVEPVGGRWAPWGGVSAAVERIADGRTDPAEGSRLPDAEAESAPSVAIEEKAGGLELAEPVPSPRAATGSTGAWLDGAIGSMTSSPTTVLVAVWLLLSLAGLVRLGRRQRALYRVLAGRRPVQDVALKQALAELSAAGGMRRPPRLTVTARCPVPVALWRGEIVVPERFLEELDREQQRAALAHEVAHQLRRDGWWLLLVHVMEAVFFFQPLVRRARTALRDSAEVLCDDWAVRQARSLGVARCLAAVAAWVSPAAEWPHTVASAMACRESALARRVERVLRRERVQPTRRAVAVATLLPLPLLLLLSPVVSADIPASPMLHTRAAAAPRPAAARDQPASHATRTHASNDAAAQERVVRTPRPSDPLAARWQWAMAEAARRGLRGSGSSIRSIGP